MVITINIIIILTIILTIIITTRSSPWPWPPWQPQPQQPWPSAAAQGAGHPSPSHDGGGDYDHGERQEVDKKWCLTTLIKLATSTRSTLTPQGSVASSKALCGECCSRGWDEQKDNYDDFCDDHHSDFDSKQYRRWNNRHYLNQLFFIVLVRLADIHGLVLHNPYPETSIQPINLDQRRSIFQIICLIVCNFPLMLCRMFFYCSL